MANIPGLDGNGTLVYFAGEGTGTNDANAYKFHTKEDNSADILTALQLIDNPMQVLGGGVEASALRVTIANDSTGVVSIDDNGGSLTVDGTVTANAGTGTFTVDLGANNDVTVQGEDAENAAAAANPVQIGGRYDLTPRTLGDGDVGAIALDADGAVHISDGGNSVTVDGTFATETTLASVIGTDGSAGPASAVSIAGTETGGTLQEVRVDADGHLQVDILSGGGTGGTSATDDAAFTAGSGSGTPAMGFFSTDTVDANDVGVLAMDASRRLMVSIEVDNVGIGGGTQYAEDDIAAANPTGTYMIAQRKDTGASLVGADGDYTGLQVTATGNLRVDIAEATALGDNYTEGNTDATISGTAVMMEDTGNTLRPLQGDIANGLDVDVTRVSGTVTVDNAGTFATQVDGAALTALQLIDDAVFTDDAAFTVASSKGFTVMGVNTADTVDAGDAGALAIDANRHLQVDIAADSVGIGGGTQYTEDDAAAANPVGNMPVMVRQDTPGALVSLDGDVVAQRATNYGAGYVQVVDSSGNFVDSFGGSGGTAAADDADFVAGTTQGTPSMGVYESTPTTVTDGDLGIIGISSDRRLLVDAQIAGQDADITIADGGNVISVDDGGGNLSVDWGGTVPPIGAGLEATALRVTLATDSTGLISVDDNGGSLTVDSTALTDIETNTDFGATTGGGTEAGALRVTLANNSTGLVSIDDNGGSLTVDNAGTFATQVDGAALTALQLIDNASVNHDAASVAGVNQIGLAARSTAGTAVGNGDAVRALGTLLGKQVNLPFAIPAQTWSYTSTAAVTDTADDVAKTAGGAGVRHYITSVVVTNSDATVGTAVTVKSATTELLRQYVAEDGGGFTAQFNPPLRGGANEAINVANITTAAETYFTLSGFTAAE